MPFVAWGYIAQCLAVFANLLDFQRYKSAALVGSIGSHRMAVVTLVAVVVDFLAVKAVYRAAVVEPHVHFVAWYNPESAVHGYDRLALHTFSATVTGNLSYSNLNLDKLVYCSPNSRCARYTQNVFCTVVEEFGTPVAMKGQKEEEEEQRMVSSCFQSWMHIGFQSIEELRVCQCD